MEAIEGFKCAMCGRIVKDPEYNIRFCPFCGKEQYVIHEMDKEVALDEEIEQIVYEWLAKTLEIDGWLVSETVKNQMATVFLLIWPILETKVFNNDMSHRQITDISNLVKDELSDIELDMVSRHFYDRYQDKNKYRKLVAGRDWTKIERVLDKPYNRIYKDEKIALMIFVVYRYRNNIFHGIKSIKEWKNFSEEIQLCIRFMVMLGNCMKIEG